MFRERMWLITSDNSPRFSAWILISKVIKGIFSVKNLSFYSAVLNFWEKRKLESKNVCTTTFNYCFVLITSFSYENDKPHLE